VPAIVLTMGESFYWPRRVQPGRHTEEAVHAAQERDDSQLAQR